MLEREAMAVLVWAKSVSYSRREAVLARAGSALEVVLHPQAYTLILGEEGAASVARNAGQAGAMLARLEKSGVRLIARGEDGYPGRLMQTARPPHVLFARGAGLDDTQAVAVVGTRRASAYGLRHTRRIASELAAAGVCVVSGLALGIDAAAHEGALDAGGRTIAVLGSGHDRMTPEANRELMGRIIAGGGSVVTEYPMGMPPTRYSFLERNRIIAGLCQGVLVTEGARRSGAQSTANHALDEGRDVFALPGDVDRVSAQLPNMLIAEGAAPVAGGAEILAYLSMTHVDIGRKGQKRRRSARKGTAEEAKTEAPKPAAQARPDAKLGEPEKKIADLLLTGDMDFDSLSEKTDIASDDLGAILMMMELDGIIEALPGLCYRRL